MAHDLSARAIICIDGYLLVKRHTVKNLTLLPGGRVQHDESLEAALLRELNNDFPGMSFDVGRELGVIEHVWGDADDARCTEHHFFEVTSDAFSPELLPRRNEPTVEFQWIPLEDLSTANVKPENLAVCLERWTGGDQSTWNEREITV